MGTIISLQSGASTGPKTIILNQGFSQTFAEDGWEVGARERTVSSSNIIDVSKNYWIDLTIQTRGNTLGSNITAKIYAGVGENSNDDLLSTFTFIDNGSPTLFRMERTFFVSTLIDSENGSSTQFINGPNPSTSIASDGLTGSYGFSTVVGSEAIITKPYLNITLQATADFVCRLGPSRITYG